MAREVLQLSGGGDIETLLSDLARKMIPKGPPGSPRARRRSAGEVFRLTPKKRLIVNHLNLGRSTPRERLIAVAGGVQRAARLCVEWADAALPVSPSEEASDGAAEGKA